MQIKIIKVHSFLPQSLGKPASVKKVVEKWTLYTLLASALEEPLTYHLARESIYREKGLT
jgi:hypothetical protein